MKQIDEVNLLGEFDIRLIDKGSIVDRRVLRNTITTAGKDMMFNYLTGGISTFLNYMGLGLGTTAASTSDIDLYHEIFRRRIESATYDTNSNKVSWHISLTPLEAVGVLGEIGMYDRNKNDADDNFGDQLLSKFDESTWTAGVVDTTNFIDGERALKITTNGTTSTLLTKSLDLSGYASSDVFSLMVYPYATTNLTNMLLIFETDASNYYTGTMTTFTAATWNHKTVAKSAFVATGSPSWNNITKIKLTATVTSGAIDITFGSLRAIVKNNVLSTLFSRRVISPAITKTSRQEMLITYSVTFT